MRAISTSQIVLISLRIRGTRRRCRAIRNIKLGVAIGRILLRRIPREIDRHARVVNTAVQQAPIQRRRNGSMEICAPRADPRQILVAPDKVLVPKRVSVICAVVRGAEHHVGSGAGSGAVDGDAAVDAGGGVCVVAGERGIRVAICICGGGAVKVGDGGAAAEDVAVFKTFGEGVSVRGISVAADDLETAFDVVGC